MPLLSARSVATSSIYPSVPFFEEAVALVRHRLVGGIVVVGIIVADSLSFGLW